MINGSYLPCQSNILFDKIINKENESENKFNTDLNEQLDSKIFNKTEFSKNTCFTYRVLADPKTGETDPDSLIDKENENDQSINRPTPKKWFPLTVKDNGSIQVKVPSELNDPGVYVFRDITNGESFIGETSRPMRKRLGEYGHAISKNTSQKHRSNRFYATAHHNPGKFVVGVVDNQAFKSTTDSPRQQEILTISYNKEKGRSVFNKNNGGNGPTKGIRKNSTSNGTTKNIKRKLNFSHTT